MSARVQWAANNAAATQQSADQQQSASQGNLQTSIVNQDLFHELIHLIETLVAQHATEAKAEFKRPLQWHSVSLQPSHFSATTTTTSGVWNIVSPGP
ncbi:UNVERIFIED_CONTAM: hypothetical protein HDU68_001547, partial [Siphonaria sp. JEL0065]